MQTQSPSAAPQPPAPPPPPAPLDADALREQIRSAIEATRQGVQDVDAPVGTPGVAVRTTPDIPDLPPNVTEVTFAFFLMVFAIAVGIPIARAVGRWVDRRGQPAARLTPELSAQLTQLTQSVEAIAIEVERISEGQRFTTRLLSEQRQRASIGAGEEAR